MEYHIIVEKLDSTQGKNRYYYLFCAKLIGLYTGKRAYDEIKANFPEPEYRVTLEVWEYGGKEVDADAFFAKKSALQELT